MVALSACAERRSRPARRACRTRRRPPISREASSKKFCGCIRRAWIIGREALRDVTLSDGSHIPSGTTVFMVPLLLHRKPIFQGSRRLRTRSLARSEPPPFAYIPFGGGARRCIGDEFALRETTIVLAAFAAPLSLYARTGARVKPLRLSRFVPPVPFRCERSSARQKCPPKGVDLRKTELSSRKLVASSARRERPPDFSYPNGAALSLCFFMGNR